MLAPSRLYSFLDHKNGFNLHFLEGQKLIHDLAVLHPVQGSGFAYFRDAFLGLLPIVFFLKPGETLGLYIDSEDPYFRLKIETNSAGHTRTLLLPENFSLFPMKITGKIRITKIFPGNKSPYTSVLDLKETETKEVINKVLNESYQTNSEVIVGELSDQSIMVTKLPPLNTNSHLDETQTRKEFVKKNQRFFHDVFETAPSDIEKIVKTFEDRGFAYLGSRMISYFCPCSKERMVLNLKGLYSVDIEELFAVEKTVKITCDYCHKKYEITRKEIEEA
ncbi:MAG TPA: Hsp33 family molecular chaperone HslO [Bacteriovoracaceae bacterium]|nr:Hsp33 family molecular chaperone HslO [Bacteriovoracaceae bacterium]